MTAYHKNLSVATGVNVGLALNDNKKDSILKIIERVYDKMKVSLTCLMYLLE